MSASRLTASSHVSPTLVSGNPALDAYGVKVDSQDLPATGETKTYVYTYGSITATITVSVYDNGSGQQFDWTSTYPITKVVAKGGPDANVYTYSSPVTSDTGLNAPVNDNSGTFFDLSHIDFYLMVPVVPAEVTAYKYEDLDRDGTHDEGEPYLSGWSLQLKSGTTVVKSGTTDSEGKVVFSDVAPGSYTVSETQQEGWVLTSTNYPVPVSVVSGDEKVVHIGNARVSDLSVLKYHDLDADGIHDDGEPALSGWTIQLLKDGSVVDSAVTAGNGLVSFDDLVPGSYQVNEVLTDGWFSTSSLPLSVSVAAGQDQLVSIGNAEYPNLSVLKFLDADRDGVRDEGEPALSGWTFHLMVEGQVAYTAQTDESGVAHFVNVDPGDYDLHEVVASPWFATTELPIALSMVANNDQSVEVGNSFMVTKTFELTYPALPAGATLMVEYSVDGGQSVTEQLVSQGEGLYSFDVDLHYGAVLTGRWILSFGQEIFVLAEFGPEILTTDLTNSFTYASVVGGMKYADENGNGVRDAGEAGLSGWTINLHRVIDGGSVLYDSTVTGEGGAYAFVGLPPGTYFVTEVMQEGWEQTDAPEGTFAVTGESQSALGLDFGNTQFAPFTPQPDTSITKRGDATTANPGDVITYTLTYKNTGDVDLEKVTIADNYDERYMTPVDVGDGVVANGIITWERFDLLVGETRTITYSLRVSRDMPAGTTVVANTAVIHPFGDTDSWSVTVENPSLPFTEDEEEFLPFTGAELTLLVLALVISLTAALVLRRMGKAF